jgi:mannose-1-phosphate guanylyltransferase
MCSGPEPSGGPTKAFLLAGGLGERLRPFTDRMPKCLAPVAGEPLLGIWLDLCVRQGVREVLVNVSRHVEEVERFLAQRSWDLKIELVHEAAPIGNAGTVLAHRDFVRGEEGFYVLYADNLTDVSLRALARFHDGHQGALTMGLFHRPAPRASGIVQMNADGRITEFTEKPAVPKGDLANAGIYVARQSLFEAIPEDRGVTDFGHDVFPALVGRMYGVVIEDFLADIGNPTALARASEQWAQYKAALSH